MCVCPQATLEAIRQADLRDPADIAATEQHILAEAAAHRNAVRAVPCRVTIRSIATALT